jgi:hypothetical protein
MTATSDAQLPSHRWFESFAQNIWQNDQYGCKIQDLGAAQSTNIICLTLTKHTIPMLGIEPLSDWSFPTNLITIVQ